MFCGQAIITKHRLYPTVTLCLLRRE